MIAGQLQTEPSPVILSLWGAGWRPFSFVSCLAVHSVSLSQPRDVTNLTVGGFTPMSPRISSPMHPSAEGEMGSLQRLELGGALAVEPESLCPEWSQERPGRRQRRRSDGSGW